MPLEEEGADDANALDKEADDMSELADEGIVEDVSDIGGKQNGMLVASFPCTAAL